ncbi:hypothetical protein DFH08DRAFT_1009139 [Mycena albidolilacea]|uniref:Uncharacterized protein n=1 Tax=Mycena albidolilacea TaxID=1033008 RepID=A0AAD6ZYB8_9AGAR|nr:hypothetical protein DFH08DRAFT_1009139 [Mycena albidolilacea]
MDSPPCCKMRLFSPKPQTRTILNFPSEIIADVPGFHTDQERSAQIRLVLQQHEELTRVAGPRRMTFQISLMDELIARARTEREKACTSLQRELKEAQDCVNAEAWQLARPPPPPRFGSYITEEDLYLDNTRPRNIGWPKLEHTCRLCLNAKSHPINTCFVCVHFLLETQWGCDECGQLVTRWPKLDVEQATVMEQAHPGWDQSWIAFGWEGLSFLAAQR